MKLSGKNRTTSDNTNRPSSPEIHNRTQKEDGAAAAAAAAASSNGFHAAQATDPKQGQSKGTEDSKIKWGKQLEFTFSCIGYSVGLGAVWRLPYLCLRNGGGAFLVAYFTCLFLCGMPLFFLELCIGQFSGLAPLSIWNVCPLFKGIGWSMVILSGIVTIYYNLILTWVLYFLGMSFTTELPWASCDHEWNTDRCYVVKDKEYLNDSAAINSTLTTQMPNLYQAVNSTQANSTVLVDQKPMTAAEEFWQFNVLELSSGIHDLGQIRWQLLVCLFAAWLLVFLCLCKGIKSSGKVAYVTASAPYLFLIILFIRGILLPGAIDGIRYYIIPDFSQLLNLKVWTEACLQIFYALGPAWGGIITMASYNKFTNNCIKDTVIVCLACGGSSFFGGLVCFTIIGHMAQTVGLPVVDVVTSGPGLAFLSFPEAITKLPISPLWSVFFFLMLLTLSLDSQFGMLETCTSGFTEEFPKYLRKHRTLFVALFCALQFFLGIPFVTQGGMYLFQILDWYSAAFSAMMIGFLECIVLAYIYGTDQLSKDIEMMLGKKPSLWWKISWRFITPAIMLALLVYSCIKMAPPTYGNYQYPGWAIGLGWALAMCSILPMPIVAINKIIGAQGSLINRIKHLLKPTEVWGPSEIHLRANYKSDPVEKDLTNPFFSI